MNILLLVILIALSFFALRVLFTVAIVSLRGLEFVINKIGSKK